MARSRASAPAAAILVLAGAAILIAVLIVAVPTFLAGDDRAAIISATVSVAGLVAAIGAAIAAFVTIFQQQVENRRQRQMETLHLVNTQYEQIFDDIYELRGAAKPAEENDLLRVHNRYFTNLMTGFRYYQLGLIPHTDFVEWTATNVGRFNGGRCLVNWDKASTRNEMKERWTTFDSWGHGPRADFRRYMLAVIAAGDEIKAEEPAVRRAEVKKAADRIVAQVRLTD